MGVRRATVGAFALAVMSVLGACGDDGDAEPADDTTTTAPIQEGGTDDIPPPPPPPDIEVGDLPPPPDEPPDSLDP